MELFLQCGVCLANESSVSLAKFTNAGKGILRLNYWYICSEIQDMPWLIMVFHQRIITPIRVLLR
ncbi:hypothetical protein CORMATOL_01331 [Corynebacterium matruchotii ATCC 33806]|uniref:Uncharacterized protein n=1 Tax=Corynebacterium matruchotii ATCC 33806 TaxID=566549 RepID=C0E2W9_9CORY|nr:hypothetical protein CORMATOL_01331 [Corynebacterium matruchotii ATCC 33806]